MPPGSIRVARPAPTRMSGSAIRSGTSFQTSPAGLPRPPSTARRPSSMLQRSRSCTQAAAARRSRQRVAPLLPGERARNAPLAAAKRTLAPEIQFGRTPALARRRASERAQRRSRVFRGRRAAALTISSPERSGDSATADGIGGNRKLFSMWRDPGNRCLGSLECNRTRAFGGTVFESRDRLLKSHPPRSFAK